MAKKEPVVCRKIRDRVDKWEKYWTINRSMYYEWMDFIMGDQWREDESKLFERYNKIPLIFNKLGVLYNHLCAEQIFNTPNLQVMPSEDAPPEAIEVRSALTLDITLNSNAKHHYQTAFGQSIVGGFSAYRVYTDYKDNESFEQHILIDSFDDPNRCYWSLDAKHICKVDGMYAGYKTRISRKKFGHKFGKDIESQIGTTAITEDSTLAFADDDSITIVDDFEREPEKITIYKLSNGETIDNKEFAKLEKVRFEGKKFIMRDGNPLIVIEKRETVRYKIKHTQIAGDFILEESYLPEKATLLPIPFVDQKSYYTKAGQQITRSFFKDVKDAQKYLNYLATQSAYMMKIGRYDQFIMPRKCAASPDTQQQWRDPSVVNGALYYDETPSGAKPEQLKPPELSQSLILQYERTLMDIQSGTGMYNTQMGEKGNEVSGEAIEARTNRGSRNSAVAFNSINIAIATGGEIINEWIPDVYDTERTLMLSTPDAESQPIRINQPMDEYGLNYKNDMRKGKYNIRLKAGPSYEGQKQEALLSLQSVLQADKAGTVFPLIVDKYVENLPLDNNIEIRNRLRTLVPPEIIEAGKTGKPLPQKPPQPSPQQMMMQLKQQELQQKAQQAQQDAQIKMQDLELKKQELQRKAIETHQDMSLSFEKLEADKEKAAAELQETILRYQAEGQRVGADLQIAHSQNLIKLLTHNPKHHKPVEA